MGHCELRIIKKIKRREKKDTMCEYLMEIDSHDSTKEK